MALHRLTHRLKRRKRLRLLRSPRRVSKRSHSLPHVWRVPEVVALLGVGERKALLHGITLLRKLAQSGVKRITLDFSRTVKMHAEATLLFVAEMRTLVHHTQGSIEWELIPSASDKVMQVLKRVELLDLLGMTFAVECKDDDVVRWLCAHGQRAEGEKYDDVMGPYEGEIAPSLNKDLYSGVTEAMTNVVHHAYSRLRSDGYRRDSALKRWWMFSAENSGRLIVLICDLGAGIPGTLPYSDDHRSLWKRLRRMPALSDVDIIAHAVTDSVSRTGESHRGRGLGQIAHAVSSVHGGRVTIMSNRGLYRYSREGGVKMSNHRYSIQGTLIYWEIPLQQGAKS